MKSFSLLLAVAGLLGCVQAAIHFKNSLILDEFDLSGQASVSLDSVCKDNGCKVYISSVKEASFIDKLSVKAGDVDAVVGLKSYTYDIDDTTKQKIPFVVQKGDSVSILNANDNLFCGPIVVYAVSSAAPNFDIAGVYDVSGKLRQEQAPGKVVTVMGPSPFTVWASSPSEALEASVYTTGFDVVDEDKCAEVYHSKRGYGVKYAVNGPITTLFFKEEVQMNVDYLDWFETALDLTAATFFTSPGFIGCANAEVFHSSLYNTTVDLELTSDIARSIRLDALLNTNEPLTLRVDGDEEAEKTFTGSIGDASYTRGGDVSARELSFSYSMTDPDASFLVKFSDLGIATTQATRRTMPPTSTTSPRPTSPTTTSKPTTATKPTTTTSGAIGASATLGLATLLALLVL